MRHFFKRIHWYYKEKEFVGWLDRTVSDIDVFEIFITVGVQTGIIKLSIESKLFPNLNMEEKEIESVESAEQEVDQFFNRMAETRKNVIKQVGKKMVDNRKLLVMTALRSLKNEASEGKVNLRK